MKIDDGKGSGKAAKVDEVNRLSTVTTEREEGHVQSLDGKAFIVNTNDTAPTLTVTVTGGFLLYFENDSNTEEMVLEKLFLAAAAAGLIVEVFKNVTIGTIGNNNIHAPVNANFASGREAPIVAFNWNEVADGMTGITGGESIATYITRQGTEPIEFNGDIILRKADNIAIRVQNAGEAAISARVYFKPQE